MLSSVFQVGIALLYKRQHIMLCNANAYIYVILVYVQFQLLAEMDFWRIVPGCIHWILHTGTAWPHHLSPAGLLEPWLLRIGRGSTRLPARVGDCHLWVWESCEPSQIVQPTGKNLLPFCYTEHHNQMLSAAKSYTEVPGSNFRPEIASPDWHSLWSTSMHSGNCKISNSLDYDHSLSYPF